jgi:hypothetical protein
MQHLPPPSGETSLHLNWSQKQDLEVRSRWDLRNSDSPLGAFISRNGTSSCAIAKLSFLVCILIFFMLPALLAFMQIIFAFKQLYNLYVTYIPIKNKLKYTNTE